YGDHLDTVLGTEQVDCALDGPTWVIEVGAEADEASRHAPDSPTCARVRRYRVRLRAPRRPHRPCRALLLPGRLRCAPHAPGPARDGGAAVGLAAAGAPAHPHRALPPPPLARRSPAPAPPRAAAPPPTPPPR